MRPVTGSPPLSREQARVLVAGGITLTELAPGTAAAVQQACAACDPRILTFETALEQREDDSEAHYWLGRTLFESGGDLARAVSERREAAQREPDNARVLYYLGQALRALVEQEILVEAEHALSRYLEALGEYDDVQAFLSARTAAEVT